VQVCAGLCRLVPVGAVAAERPQETLYKNYLIFYREYFTRDLKEKKIELAFFG
jgi:hypothetical protein